MGGGLETPPQTAILQSLLNYLLSDSLCQERNFSRSSAAAGEHQPVADAAVFFQNSGPRRGAELQELGIIKDGAVLCSGGKIVSACSTKDALHDPWIRKNRKKSLRSIVQNKSSCPDLWTRTLIPCLLRRDWWILRSAFRRNLRADRGSWRRHRSSVEGVRKAGKPLLVEKSWTPCVRWPTKAPRRSRPSPATG